MEDIATGSEITISYVDLMASTPVRQTKLWKEKYFHCDCTRCGHVENDFSVGAFACKKCKQPVVSPVIGI